MQFTVSAPACSSLDISCSRFPENLALQRFGVKWWIALLMITWGLISACMALTRTPRSFYVLRFLLGSAEEDFFRASFCI